MKQYFKFYGLILAVLMICAYGIISCDQDDPIPAPPPPPTISQPIYANVDSIIDASLGCWEYLDVSPFKGQCWFVFEPEITNANCRLKFLYYCDSTVTDTTLLTLGLTPGVGTAHFVVDSIKTTIVGSDTLYTYYFPQRGEEFEGVFNNNAICNNYNTGGFFKLVTFIETPLDSLLFVGDTLYINFK